MRSVPFITTELQPHRINSFYRYVNALRINCWFYKNHGFAIRTRLYTCTSVVPSSDKQCSLYKQVYRISKLFYKLKAVMSITENFLILVLHVTLVLPLEGILLQNQDCGQCIAPLEHQVALLQQRLETLEQSKLMHFNTIILLFLI